ncbi:P27 family phage terminase small subunit [Lutimaribacter marinistellae]|uniref:P27 family phage terminase small subunit n=1 Tax=Lutimaribacter marinistellae TaxID=1820329 RepID=A0ABV7TFA6_9RHOB
MGRKRTPDRLKVVAGTDRPCRMNPDAPAAPVAAPEAPAWLSERATEIFDGITLMLVEMQIASVADTWAQAMLASRLEEIEVCTAVLEDGGRTYLTTATSGDKLVRARPEVAQRSEAMRHAQSLLAEFGLTPAARSRVSANKTPDQNPFAALDRMT